VPCFEDPFQEAGSGPGDANPTRPPCPLYARNVHVSGRKSSQEELTRALGLTVSGGRERTACLDIPWRGLGGLLTGRRHPVIRSTAAHLSSEIQSINKDKPELPAQAANQVANGGRRKVGIGQRAGCSLGTPGGLALSGWRVERQPARPGCQFHFVAGRFGAARPASCRRLPAQTVDHPFRGLFLRLLPRIVQSPSIQHPSSVPLWRGRSFVADGNPPISISHPPTP
jgi:hypothetical protein